MLSGCRARVHRRFSRPKIERCRVVVVVVRARNDGIGQPVKLEASRMNEGLSVDDRLQQLNRQIQQETDSKRLALLVEEFRRCLKRLQGGESSPPDQSAPTQ